MSVELRKLRVLVTAVLLCIGYDHIDCNSMKSSLGQSCWIFNIIHYNFYHDRYFCVTAPKLPGIKCGCDSIYYSDNTSD